ncbi:type II secretion system protein GspD [Mucilaginibacter sp.]|uniref:type II secretion system protein GspD n=1 Tax=Mucilaginibacter sp. TaxID=1882438 RepID=UPI003D0F7A66
MYKKFTLYLLLIFFFGCPLTLLAQQDSRIGLLQEKLERLSAQVPGLNNKVQLVITGVPVTEYLSALAKSNDLNISIDPKINFVINDTFNNATAANILLLLAGKYSLDISVVGTILNITSYQDPGQFAIPKAKDIKAKYNQLDNTLSLELDNDSLTAVAHKITLLSGKNVVVPNALQGKKVSAFIAPAPFETTLEKLAFTNELKMVRTNDDFYMFQPLGDGEELYVNGDRKTSIRKAFRPVSQGPGGGMELFSRQVNGQKLISANAVNVPVLDLVKQASQELNIDYSIYSEIKGTITIHVKDRSYESFLGLLFKGTNYTFHSDNGVYMIGERTIEGLRTYEMITLQHRSIDTVMSLIPTDWKKNLDIKEFREQNTLMVSGSASQIAEVKTFVKQLDVLVPVVMIEVTLIDVHKSRTIATGISAGTKDSVKSGGTVLSGLNYTFNSKSINSFLNNIGKVVNLGHVTPNFYVTLSALESNSNVDARSVPRLTALNGHSATLSIGNSVYYKNSTQNYIPSVASSQTILTNTYIESDANMTISIKPIVSGDDQVTLGINVDISDFTSIPTDGSPPPKSTSKFQSSIRVNNEDMIVLGGIERTERDETASGIPLLSRIPVLKWLFSSRSKTNSKVVTLVFIKPTILR